MNARIAAASVIALVALIATPTGATAAPSGVFQLNAAHTGEATGETFTPPLHRRWTQAIGEAMWNPLIGDGRVFALSGVTNQPPVLHAFEQATGREIWAKPAVRTRLGYGRGRLVTLEDQGRLAALDPSDGREVWATQLTGMSHFDDDPTAVDGVVYVVGTSPGNKVYAVNEADGRLMWSTDLPTGGGGSYPAVAGGLVYVSWSDVQVYALDAATGTVRWHYSGPSTGGGGVTPVVANGRVFTRGTANTDPGYVLDAATGEYKGGYTALAPPSISGGIALYPTDAGIVARNIDDGGTRWSAPDGIQPPVIVNGVAYVGQVSGLLRALRMDSGQELWRDTVGSGYVRPMAAGEGLLAVPSGNALVVYEGTQTGSPGAGPAPAPSAPPASLRMRSLKRLSIGQLRRTGMRLTVGGGTPKARMTLSLTVRGRSLVRVRRTLRGTSLAVRLRPHARAAAKVRPGDRLRLRVIQTDPAGKRTALARTITVTR